MGTLIDSSVFVAAQRGDLDLDGHLDGVLSRDHVVAIAAVTASELIHGVHRLKGASKTRAAAWVERVLARVPVAPFDLAAARAHAALSADLASRRIEVGAHDLLIAATAVELGYDVATHRPRSYSRIRGLTVRRW